ncbi:MAG: LysR family transcriptional regulator [Jannaschia sp.]
MAQSHFTEQQVVNRLKLRYLRFLLCIDEERSISSAAAQVDISQPAATKLLREIEQIVGARLFERSRYRVEPTPAGELVLRASRRVLSEVRRLTEELNALSGGQSGRVAVGSLISASATLVPVAVARLARDFPEIMVHIAETTEDILLPSLKVGDLDMVLGRLPRHLDPDLAMRVLYEERFCIVARPGHPVHAPGADLRHEISTASWILPPSQTMTRQETEQTLAAQGYGTPRVVAESAAVHINLRALQAGDLLSAMPMNFARSYAAEGIVRIVAAGPEFPSNGIGVITRAGTTPTPAAARLLATLDQVAWTLHQGEGA